MTAKRPTFGMSRAATRTWPSRSETPHARRGRRGCRAATPYLVEQINLQLLQNGCSMMKPEHLVSATGSHVLPLLEPLPGVPKELIEQLPPEQVHVCPLHPEFSVTH